MSVISPSDKWPESRWGITIFPLPSPTCPALHSVLHFVLLGSFRGCTCGFGTICKSVPVVSHKFKSGLTVSKEMGLSAMEVCPRSYFKDCGSHSAVTGLNANFSFRQVTSFRPSVNASTTCEWAAIVARSVHWGHPVIHFTDIAFKHDVHISSQNKHKHKHKFKHDVHISFQNKHASHEDTLVPNKWPTHSPRW